MTVAIKRDKKGRFIKGSNIGHPPYGGFNTRFKKGHSIVKGSEKGWFKKGENHILWKGDRVGYDGLHSRIEKQLGKPKKCDLCKSETSKKYEWSNISGDHINDISDWQRLCTKCHMKYDFEKFGAREVFYAK